MAVGKILVTGGSGFIGGSVIAGLLSPSIGASVSPSDIVAVVRKDEHVEKMTPLGIKVIKAALDDGQAIEKIVLEENVDVVIHCASSMELSLARPLIEALAKRKAKTGGDVYFVHTSGTSCFTDKTGWDHGAIRDTDPVYQMEKENAGRFPIRDVNIAVNELTKQFGIVANIVVPPYVYGEGSGEVGRQTILTPMIIKASIDLKAVNAFPDSKTVPAVHVKDLIDFYVRLIQDILSGNSPSGYWFPVAHHFGLQEMHNAMAKSLHGRGLVDSPTLSFWSGDEAAGKALGFPVNYIPLVFHSSSEVIPVRASKELDWEPKWNSSEKFLGTVDAEVDTYIRLSDKSGLPDRYAHLINKKD